MTKSDRYRNRKEKVKDILKENAFKLPNGKYIALITMDEIDDSVGLPNNTRFVKALRREKFVSKSITCYRIYPEIELWLRRKTWGKRKIAKFKLWEFMIENAVQLPNKWWIVPISRNDIESTLGYVKNGLSLSFAELKEQGFIGRSMRGYEVNIKEGDD